MMNSPINMFVCHIDGVVLTVNIAIILFEYSPFYRHSRSFFRNVFVEIVLNDTLQQAQVGRPVLDLAGLLYATTFPMRLHLSTLRRPNIS